MSPSEIAARIDAHWDFRDPEASARAFRVLLDEPDAGAMRSQVLTQLARTCSLQRRFDEADRILDEIETRLEREPPLVRVRYLLERGRTRNSAGAPAEARPLFAEAHRLASELGEDFYAVDAAHMIAIVETPEQATAWNERALQQALASADPRTRRWEGSLCNNLGWTAHAQGDFEQALALFERALNARRRGADDREIRIARWCVARALRSLGRVEEALAIQRTLLAELDAAGDANGFVHEELGECLLELHRAGEARPHFRRAHSLLAADPGLAEHEPERLARLDRLAGPDR